MPGRLPTLLVPMLALAGCAASSVPSSEAPAPAVEASEAQPNESQGTRAPRGTIDIAVIDAELVPIAHQLVDVALADPRTRAVHEGQPYEVAEVSVVDEATARVLIEFDDPLPPEAWPPEAVCAIYRESDDITGIAWRISLASMEVVSVSPQWDYSVACS